MSKNAKIAVVVIVLAVIALIVVLCSTVFAVQSARLVWYNTPTSSLSALSDEKALEISGMQGESVFILDKDAAIQNLESKYTNLRVRDIEVVWPNIVNIHVVERQQVYAIKLSNGEYAITDEYLKVLDVVSSFDSTNINPVLLSISGLEGSYEKGDTVDFKYSQTFIDVYNAFLSLGRDLTEMRAMFESMEYTNAKMTIKTHFDVDIIVDNPTQNTIGKINAALIAFDYLETEDYGKLTLEVFLNSNNLPEVRMY